MVRFGLSLILVGLSACIGLQDLGDRSADPNASPEGNRDGGDPDGGSGDGPSKPNPQDDASTTGMRLVPAGTFPFAWGTSGNTSSVKLTHAFYVDATEVTVGQFRAWTSAGRPAPCPGEKCSLETGGPYTTTMTWEPADDNDVGREDYKSCSDFATSVGPTFAGTNDNAPINCVTWAQAAAVCHFRGLRLPTEVEWQYVASGRGAARTYPWGESAPTDCTQAVWGLGGTIATPKNGCGFPNASSTGDVTLDGVRDLGGSLAEWVFSRPPVAVAGPPSLDDDWAGPARVQGEPGFGSKSVRGGSFSSLAPETRSVYGTSQAVNTASATIGFRCARTKL